MLGRRLRVQWDDVIVNDLAQKVADLRLANPVPSLTELLNTAQAMLLPTDLQRPKRSGAPDA